MSRLAGALVSAKSPERAAESSGVRFSCFLAPRSAGPKGHGIKAAHDARMHA